MLNDNEAFQWSQLYKTEETIRQVQLKSFRQQEAMGVDQGFDAIEDAAFDPWAIEDDDDDRSLHVPWSNARKSPSQLLNFAPSKFVPPKHRRMSRRKWWAYWY